MPKSKIRYVVLEASVLMQLCLGATYAWSVFVGPLRELTGLSQGTVQAPFTLFYVAFPATMLYSGLLSDRIGPRAVAALGGVLFGGRWIAAGFGSHHFAWTVIGVGLLGGMGVGCAYIVPIATCVKWFPERPGLVTGISVAGFGGGAALVTLAGYGYEQWHSFVPALWGIAGLLLLAALLNQRNLPAMNPSPSRSS